jgi:hypothetical protein
MHPHGHLLGRRKPPDQHQSRQRQRDGQSDPQQPSNATLGTPNPATLTIIDDESPPLLGEQRLCR